MAYFAGVLLALWLIGVLGPYAKPGWIDALLLVGILLFLLAVLRQRDAAIRETRRLDKQ